MRKKNKSVETKTARFIISMYPWQRAKLDIAANNARMYLGPYLVERGLAPADSKKDNKKKETEKGLATD